MPEVAAVWFVEIGNQQYGPFATPADAEAWADTLSQNFPWRMAKLRDPKSAAANWLLKDA